ncbi:E3 ubiquitin-protein ligase MARCH6-like [Anneissia japonica]|uniref:E3 ubiquitin-protein ligase MARCH6-like n=1 Tax=Anneissia japonica TaxID=1529436 RepID=UPI001425906D|nr:E3 ubiquitin-protein ligase MARCH6-like [Anneissia japonica]
MMVDEPASQQEEDICRVCRAGSTAERPLFHPCICTGSIKYIHQDCLVQWLKHSKKEYCELCRHRFIFTPIYAPDMPARLPVKDIAKGLLKNIATAVKCWLHYTLVTFAWLGVVPVAACCTYNCLFQGSIAPILNLPSDIFSIEALASDIVQGCFIVGCTLCAFISLVWLREQVVNGGGPQWLEQQPDLGVQNQPQPQQLVVNDENAAEGAAAEGEAAENGGPDDLNWNALEWDRAAEELTWERMLGLDGSLIFLEHVFWVISLNALFVFMFAFFPYQLGQVLMSLLQWHKVVGVSRFDSVFTTILGYLGLTTTLLILHSIGRVLTFERSRRFVGMCYIMLKVFLLVVLEIGVFPLICGWWLDVCSLSLFNSTLHEREEGFTSAPGTYMFLHWLVGMVYVFYFASFVLLLREILRPGVLWFLRNLNDPDFNPIQEMIHLPIYNHVRRFLLSVVVFGSVVLLMLWLPVSLIKFLFPLFLPYHVQLSSDAPVSELSLELLLLQVVLPALLEQGHTRLWLKNSVRGWCVSVAYLLDLRSYLIGDVPLEDNSTQENTGIVEEHADGQDNLPENEEDEENVYQLPEDVDQQEQDDLYVQWPEEVALLEENLALDNNLNIDAFNIGMADDIHQQGQNDIYIQWPEDVPLLPENLAPDDHLNIDDSDVEMVEDLEEEGDAALIDEPEAVPIVNHPPPVMNGLHPVHQGLLNQGQSEFQPYKRTSYFTLKLVLLVALMCITLFLASFMCLTIPVAIGRKVMSMYADNITIHELYTAACGIYTCWLACRFVSLVFSWVPEGFGAIFDRLKRYALLAMKSLVVAVVLLGVVPLLIGLLFELVVVIPLRVPMDQTPVFFLWQDWALGVLHTKILGAVTMMGPNWWLKTALEQIYQDGFRNLNLTFISRNMLLPVVSSLLLSLTLPYVIAMGILPVLGFSEDTLHTVERRIYPTMLASVVLVSVLFFQLRQFKRLYEHIKNDKYLVGQQLVNYEHKKMTESSTQTTTT